MLSLALVVIGCRSDSQDVATQLEVDRVRVVDVGGDLADIFAGRETAEDGKQLEVGTSVNRDRERLFNTKRRASRAH